MALFQRTYTRAIALISRNNKSYSTSSDQNIKKSVFVSQSKDIYTNLALEDWLYRNFDFKNHHVLMLWQNDPCVVIGRHQNPWLEANVNELPYIGEQGVQLARRNSGGGTVYHDNGNLNLTFFTPRDQYNRKYNLEIISRSLFRNYNMKVDISPREDLTIRNLKISGTAAKLGRTNAYHHCTLLVNVNKVDLSMALQKPEADIKTNATQSVRSKIMNLCEENPMVNVKNLITSIGWEYMRMHPLKLVDGGMEHANKQNGFQLVNPTEGWFPGLTEIKEQLLSWNWQYEKTPKFNITKSFKVHDTLAENYGINEDLKVNMVVENGKISDISLYVPPGLSSQGFSGNANVITSLIGHTYSEDAVHDLEMMINGLVNEKLRFGSEHLKQVMNSF
ncbi:lipoyltransferase 1, mitochondrial isoform X2 [Diabrotica virgifera virgifera]|uniref:Lipoyltransferase 1, mitochondrial isoform X2 n=1 Tax=Diabrotica virgifera virgifera TaxID=50390 RepID=A0A6P7H197_DIAVI|nr:lipoyltransferase 1, mitochondrial isoform X2 [Diabrotica virgifera virgifera]